MKNTHYDHRTDIENWQSMWDEIQSSNVLPVASKTSASSNIDFDLGDFSIDSEDGLLQEDKTPNPVYPDSIGQDGLNPEPAWVDEKLLKQVEQLKNRLFKLENQMAKMGQDGKFSEKKIFDLETKKKMFSEIKALRGRIDRVSDQLGISHEPSPWQIKRD